MNSKQWDAMSPEEQQIKIAELTGKWENIKNDWFSTCNGEESYLACSPAGDPACRIGVPDYLGDLNAMHEAIAWLNREQQLDYLFELAEICGKEVCPLINSNANWRPDQLFQLSEATAAQRAKAFALTMEPE